MIDHLIFLIDQFARVSVLETLKQHKHNQALCQSIKLLILIKSMAYLLSEPSNYRVSKKNRLLGNGITFDQMRFKEMGVHPSVDTLGTGYGMDVLNTPKYPYFDGSNTSKQNRADDLPLDYPRLSFQSQERLANVHLSVSPSQKPLSLSESCLSLIMPISLDL